MGSSYAQGLFLLLTVSMFAVSMANKWPSKDVSLHHNKGYSKKIMVGGSENWRFGFNYTKWALKKAPFYLNDTLVFKYDPPTNTTFPHDVYLLPNHESFLQCDFKNAKLVGNVTRGGGKGFKFVLKKRELHYFACSQHDLLHCKVGMMKFFVMPLIRQG